MQLQSIISLILPTIVLAGTVIEQKAFYCPKANSFSNGRSCNATCFYDRPGGDYARHKTNSDQTCFDLCGLDPQCVTAQYKKSTGFCYFKHSTHNLVYDNNIDTVDCSMTPPTTTTSDSTSAPTATPAAIACDDAQQAYCLQDPNRCLCALNADHTTATCYSTLSCDYRCTSDANCQPGFRCAYDVNDNCRRGSPSLVCVGSVRDTHCNASPPSRSIKRDLEKVFEDAKH